MREQGLTHGGCNVRIRSVNSYLSWLHDERHVSERLRIKLLPNPPKPNDFSDASLRRLLTYRPKPWAPNRSLGRSPACRLDTGIRTTEALNLEREHVDLDALVLRVFGKGNKIRWCPSGWSAARRCFVVAA